MLIKTKQSWQLSEHEVTEEKVYQQRRKLLKQLGFLGSTALMSQHVNALDWFSKDKKDSPFKREALAFQKTQYQNQVLTPAHKVTTHNNFYRIWHT